MDLAHAALAGAAAVATVAAARYRHRTFFWSQPDIDSWEWATEAELATLLPSQSQYVTGEVRSLMVRHETPVDVATPYYWVTMGVQFRTEGEELLDRPVRVAWGWAENRRAALDCVNDASETLFDVAEPEEEAPEDLDIL